jgi:hypothetical protein
MNAHLPAVQLRGPYRARPIRPLPLATVKGWRLKPYGIAQPGGQVSEPLVRRAILAAGRALPRVGDHYGVGFLTIHDAADLSYALVSWWAAENEVHQLIFSAPAGTDEELAPHPPPAIGCVWELFVTGFERQAWVDEVLARPDGPDVEGYLSKTFSADV